MSIRASKIHHLVWVLFVILSMSVLSGCVNNVCDTTNYREMGTFREVVYCLYKDSFKQVEQCQRKDSNEKLTDFERKGADSWVMKHSSCPGGPVTEDDKKMIYEAYSMVSLCSYQVKGRNLTVMLQAKNKRLVEDTITRGPYFIYCPPSDCSEFGETFAFGPNPSQGFKNYLACVLLKQAEWRDEDRDYNGPCFTRETLLMIAALIGDIRLAEWLIAHGADPNTETPEFSHIHWSVSPRMTALHYAAIAKNRDFYTYLVSKGGREEKKDALGNTPRYYMTHDLFPKDIYEKMRSKTFRDNTTDPDF